MEGKVGEEQEEEEDEEGNHTHKKDERKGISKGIC